MKKTLIALCGPANTGKTTTIRMALEQLKSQYWNQWICEKKYKWDITAILTIKDRNSRTKKKIGIESQGDPKSRLPDSLRVFIRLNCKVIVCATRVKGATAKSVMSLSQRHGYNLIFCDQVAVPAARQKANNRKMANQIFLQVIRALTT